MTADDDGLEWIQPGEAIHLSTEAFQEQLRQMAKRECSRQRELVRQQFADLLKHYRTKKRYTQQQLATESRLSKSYIAMLEQERCDPPSIERLLALVEGLELNDYQNRKLLAASAGLLGRYKPFIPRSSCNLAAELADHSMIWIVGDVPVEFQNGYKNALYSSLLERVSKSRTRFVYWLPARLNTKFDDLRRRVETDLEKANVPASVVPEQLACITTPSFLCFQQIAIYDPLDPAQRVGRIGIRGRDGEVAGAVPMAASQLERSAEFFGSAFYGLQGQRQYEVERLTFTKYFP